MHGHGGYRRRRGHSVPSSSRARAILRACPRHAWGGWTVGSGWADIGQCHSVDMDMSYVLFENVSQPWRPCGAVCKVYVSLLSFLSSPVPQLPSVPHSGTARNCTRTGGLDCISGFMGYHEYFRQLRHKYGGGGGRSGSAKKASTRYRRRRDIQIQAHLPNSPENLLGTRAVGA